MSEQIEDNPPPLILYKRILKWLQEDDENTWNANSVMHDGSYPYTYIITKEYDGTFTLDGDAEIVPDKLSNLPILADAQEAAGRIEHELRRYRFGLDFTTLRRANIQRCEAAFHRLESWSPTDWACAMGGECGEAQNLIKKLRRGEKVIIADIGKELADMVIYADLLAARLGIDLGQAVRNKFNEVSDRRNCAIKL